MTLLSHWTDAVSRAGLVGLVLGCGTGKGPPDVQPATGGGTLPAGTTRDTGTTCFPLGTLVATPTGPRGIGSLRPGDKVVSWDLVTGTVVHRRVARVHRSQAASLVVLQLPGGEEVEATPEHPFYSLSRRSWVVAGEVRVGESLAALMGAELESSTVLAIARRESSDLVVNLSVEGPEHDFFAGGVLVHNKISPTFWWVDDGELPVDSDGDGIWDAGCADRLEIDVRDPLGVMTWQLGLYEPGRVAEDCTSAGAACHSVSSRDVLVQACDPGQVVPGVSTAFDASRDAALTYYLSDGPSCFLWGPDQEHYDGLNCSPMN